MSKEITITNCQECPFANKDMTWGYDGCNLSPEVTKVFSDEDADQLPSESVHELCP